MRPIDADKVMEEINRIGGHNLCEWETIGVKALIGSQDTLDVVPREEVDRLRHILDSYAIQYGTVKDQNEVIDRIKAEVAREIFEEIDILGTYNPPIYAELKKKYTEGSTDGKRTDR